MTTFRILDQSPVYFDLAGNLADGGSLKFYAAGTTAPQDVYGDPDKTVNNGSSVLIGTDGRAVVQIWGEGSYRVRLYDADGTLVSDADNVEVAGGAGAVIPALLPGKFLTNDGAVMSWGDVLQVPDPTGSASKVLGTDGTNLLWQEPPATPDLPALPSGGITQSSGYITIGAVAMQWGSGTMPASGTNTTNATVSFGTAFSGTPYHVGLFGNSGSGVTSGGGLLILSAASRNTSGFIAWGDTNGGFSSGSHPITSTTPFTWFAIGPK